jgi:cellulose synthase/poly-beta-1,6-N-acetylglucosamine synthase-like glycosyltransferase
MVSEPRDRIYKIKGFKVPTYLAKLLPEDVADKYCLAPISLYKDRLVVVSAYPLPQHIRITIEKLTRYPLEFLLASFEDVRDIQSRLYQRKTSQPIPISPEVVLQRLGLLNSIQLESLLQKQAASGKYLPTIALEDHLITEAQWGEVAGLCTNSPHFSPWNASPLKGIDSLFSLTGENSQLLPVWWVENDLYLASSNPEELESSFGVKNSSDFGTIFVCAPSLFQVMKRKVFSYVPNQSSESEEEIARQLVLNGLLSETKLSVSKEINRRTQMSIRSIVMEQFGISSKQWLEALAANQNVSIVHKDDFQQEKIDKISGLLKLLPIDILFKKNIFPISLENGHFSLAVLVPNPQLMELITALTGYPVDEFLTDEETLLFLFDQFKTELHDNHSYEPENNTVSFAEFLIRTGFLQENQYLELSKQFSWRRNKFCEVLTETKIFDESKIAELLSFFYCIPSISLEYFQFDEQLINRIPAKLTLDHHILPLFENGEDIWVSIIDPERDIEYINDIEQFTNKRVWPVLAPKSLVLPVLTRFYQVEKNSSDEKASLKLIDQLVGRGVINRYEANMAMRGVLDEKIPLDQALLRLEKLDKYELYIALSAILNFNYKSLALVERRETFIDPLGKKVVRQQWLEPVDAKTAHLIDLKTAERLCVLPISQSQDQVVVAFADPLFESARDELSVLLNRKIIPCLTPRDELEAAIQRSLGQVNLGSALLMGGLITLSQLNDALTLAHDTNVRLGRALVYKRYITEKQLYQFLADQTHLPVFDLSEVELSCDVAQLIDADMERKLGILPLAVEGQKMTMAITDPINKEAIQQAETKTGLKTELILVTEKDFDSAMEILYKDEYLSRSVSQLLERTPEDSAYRILSRGQIIFLILFFVASAVWVVLNFVQYLIVINALATLFYLLFSIYKCYIMFMALNNDLEVPVSDEEVAALDEKDLPIYTILVPVYKEAEVLGNIIDRLSQMDYPLTKLDVKILMEADDLDTINVFYKSNPPAFIQEVIVPAANPKTKPKACNYGLIHAKGEFLVIYDAEDLPDRDQLKKVAVAYQKVPDNVVCIQTKLNYYNRNQNLLTQWFTSEYSMWFDLLLPGLDASQAPIPLGGTSNHFRTLQLIEIGAWDPYNVTEDADLGMRLYKRGYRTKIVDSTTLEEANSQIPNWVRQRSRWVKGYIQTWLVHMRHPVRLFKELGVKAFFSFQMLIGGTFFALLMNPIYWVMTTVWYLTRWNLIQTIYPGIIFYMGALCLYVGNFIFTYANIAGAIRHKYYDLVRSALFSPIYWALMSIGAWKGLFQLFLRPHFWEKTHHGLSEPRRINKQEQNDPVIEQPVD